MVTLEPNQMLRVGSFLGFFYLLSYIQLCIGIAEATYSYSYRNTIGGTYYVWELLLCDAILDIIWPFIKLILLGCIRYSQSSTKRNIILIIESCYFCVMAWNVIVFNGMNDETTKYWDSIAPQALYYIHFHTFLFYTYIGCLIMSAFDTIPSFSW